LDWIRWIDWIGLALYMKTYLGFIELTFGTIPHISNILWTTLHTVTPKPSVFFKEEKRKEKKRKEKKKKS
jgi:hypothetical protein